MLSRYFVHFTAFKGMSWSDYTDKEGKFKLAQRLFSNLAQRISLETNAQKKHGVPMVLFELSFMKVGCIPTCSFGSFSKVAWGPRNFVQCFCFCLDTLKSYKVLEIALH